MSAGATLQARVRAVRKFVDWQRCRFLGEVDGIAACRLTRSHVCTVCKEICSSALPSRGPRQAPYLGFSRSFGCGPLEPVCCRICEWWMVMQGGRTLRCSDHRSLTHYRSSLRQRQLALIAISLAARWLWRVAATSMSDYACKIPRSWFLPCPSNDYRSCMTTVLRCSLGVAMRSRATFPKWDRHSGSSVLQAGSRHPWMMVSQGQRREGTRGGRHWLVLSGRKWTRIIHGGRRRNSALERFHGKQGSVRILTLPFHQSSHSSCLRRFAEGDRSRS